ncbi:translocation protein [Hanseniaspora valbyensis NRRL Y-1626]|uniref:Translocation protein SEC62 n=1 Tax=Hanseniaspora valbyensis NRRL Y-1626 TaxID=766949 RepID=A0A1B7TEQ0_9ASCO|nr:translocation protein [Hanseniaspora valbyensis NRRL Y-1626]
MSAPPQQMQVPKIVVEKLVTTLRDHPDLKEREGLLKLPRPEQGTGETLKKLEFFRLKRMIRAIQSKEFTQMLQENEEVMKQLKNTTRDECIRVFVLILTLKLVTPVIKPSHQVLKKEFNTKPNKEFPTLLPITQEVVELAKKSPDLNVEDIVIDFGKPERSDDRYFSWNIETLDKNKQASRETKGGAGSSSTTTASSSNSLWDKLKIVLILSVGITLVLYPVWPYKLRVSVYYLSYVVLGLLAVFFAMAVLRYILYLITLPVFKAKGGFWIFPNLFEDCGFFDSFKPIYGFGEENTYSYLQKVKKQKNKEKKQLKNETKEKKD